MLANSFTNPSIVAGYEAWYETTGRRADRLEKALLKRLLAGFPRVRALLEVGCGTGHFTWMARLCQRGRCRWLVRWRGDSKARSFCYVY